MTDTPKPDDKYEALHDALLDYLVNDLTPKINEETGEARGVAPDKGTAAVARQFLKDYWIPKGNKKDKKYKSLADLPFNEPNVRTTEAPTDGT